MSYSPSMHTDSIGQTVVGPADGGPANRQAKVPAVYGNTQQKPGVLMVNVGYARNTVLAVYDSVYPMPEPGAVFQVASEHVQNLMDRHGATGKIMLHAQYRKQPQAQPQQTAPAGYKYVLVPDQASEELANPAASVPARVAQEHENKKAQREQTIMPQQAMRVETVESDSLLDFMNSDMPDAAGDGELDPNMVPDAFIAAVTAFEEANELEDILDVLNDE